MSLLGSISYTLGISTCSCSLPQIILAQMKTMKVALNPNPMGLVNKSISKPTVPVTNLQEINSMIKRKKEKMIDNQMRTLEEKKRVKI